MSSRPIILIVEPTHFEVSYRINPWMQPERWANDPAGLQAEATRAFLDIRNALERAGCEVVVAQGMPGLPDMVFPANAAIVLDGRALLARFRYPQRRAEEVAFLALFQVLQARGLISEIAQFSPGCFQEGAGDAIWDDTRQWFWAGYGPRSSRESLACIESFFGRKVVALELATESCYHLDVCFCPLSGGEILYYPPALTPEALHTVHSLVPPELRIEASDEDLAHFSVNAVCAGKELVMSTPPARLRDKLAQAGYRIHEVDLSPFILSGGGAFCLTLRLDRVAKDRVAKDRVATDRVATEPVVSRRQSKA